MLICIQNYPHWDNYAPTVFSCFVSVVQLGFWDFPRILKFCWKSRFFSHDFDGNSPVWCFWRRFSELLIDLEEYGGLLIGIYVWTRAIPSSFIQSRYFKREEFKLDESPLSSPGVLIGKNFLTIFILRMNFQSSFPFNLSYSQIHRSLHKAL